MGTAQQGDLRVVLAAGGTGGHVYPALAVAAELRRERPAVQFLFIGGDRMEARLAPAAGLPFRAISVHGIAGRGFSGLARRARGAAEVALGIPLLQSLLALCSFGPRVVVGTGGYVSGPVLLAARLLGIPSLSLEGDRTPGWTSRVVCRLVDVMAVAWPEQARFYRARTRRGCRVAVTGLPVRQEVLAATREAGSAALGLNPALTTVVVLGGSLGSRRINQTLPGALKLLDTPAGRLAGVQVLHVTGERYGAATGPRSGKKLSADYRGVPYLHGAYAQALAAADVVISRAGAGTVAELTARGIPALLIPWSRASRGEQTLNAAPLARAGAAVVIADAELTEGKLAEALGELLWDDERRRSMARSSRLLGRPRAAQQVAALALELAARKRRG